MMRTKPLTAQARVALASGAPLTVVAWVSAVAALYLFAGAGAWAAGFTASGEVLGFLRQCVQDYGQSIVMVTHDPRAASFADRVLVLSDGSITQDMDHPTYDDILAVFAEHDDPDNGPVDVEPAAREA